MIYRQYTIVRKIRNLDDTNQLITTRIFSNYSMKKVKKATFCKTLQEVFIVMYAMAI